MREKNNDGVSVNGLGTGYVSLIMIFVIICLTALAVMSFSAAGMNDSMRERHRENAAAYYEAERNANRILMKIDEAAYNAAESGLFMTFADTAALTEGVTVTPCPDGYNCSWSCPVTEKLTLVCAVTVCEEPALHEGRRYIVTEWQTVPADMNADTAVNVWDGTF